MAFRDMEDDSPRFEQGEIALFIGRDLPERMKRDMRGLLHRFERNKTNVVRLAYFFKCPSNAHVTRQPLATIGRPFKGGKSNSHCCPPELVLLEDDWPNESPTPRSS
ncbi:hypothetical protein D3C72_2035710 [compost metagenome]